MRVYHNSHEPDFNQVVATIGVFDGLHLGHQQLIQKVLDTARKQSLPALIITFWPHPAFYFDPDRTDFKLLMSLEEKLHQLEVLGVQHVLVLDFDQKLADTAAEQFVQQTLVTDLCVSQLIIGDDHRFGKGRSGSFQMMQKYGRENGMRVEQMSTLEEKGARVSSTRIRESLLAGQLHEANRLLGFPFYIFGRVIAGNQLGRKIGYPTANLECCDSRKQIPGDGVYAVMVNYKNQSHPGMLNVGTRPTVESQGKKSIEVHLFDVDMNLYGADLKVSFISRIRDELKFHGLEELKAQLQRDKASALNILEAYKIEINT